MSHFTVTIIGDNIETQLEPFRETEEGPYVIFKPIEAELRKSYEIDTTTCFVEPIGTPHLACDKRFANPKYRLSDDNSERYLCPKGWTEQRVAINRLYTWETYLSDYCDEKPDEKTGLLGYWENPNAKWDWYEIGGRWSDSLQLKDGTKTNQARFGDIDWEKMIDEKATFWQNVYDYVWPKIKDSPEVESWGSFCDKISAGTMTLADAHEKYSNQPRVKIATELMEILGKKTADDLTSEDAWMSYNLQPKIAEFSGDRSMFIKTHAEESVSTFAILTNGRWLERGSMGWFGVVANEKDPETWASIWSNVIRNTDLDKLVTVVDCHI
jgi:hypothetical protein